MALIDLTQPFANGMYSQRLFPPVKVERCLRIEERGVNVTCVEFAVHAGTHVDAFRHFVPDGAAIDSIPLESFAGRAVGWAVSRAAGEAITIADLEAGGPAAEPGDIVFISTGWGSYFHGEPERYRRHPYLSVDAALWLVERRVKLCCFDLPTPDQPEEGRPAGFDWPVHHALLEGGVLIAEHAANLDRVAGRRFQAFALPIPFVGGDGSPVRLVAEL
jgi:kynurenine formamidase